MVVKRGSCDRIVARRVGAAVAGVLLAVVAGARPAQAADLGSGQLLIAGTELIVSPESQTVPFDTPTIVETRLEGYDPEQGQLPADLRVLADFRGPQIEGVLVLETVPGAPLRIPRLRLEGEYLLENIRLLQGGELLAYASPRSAVVRVTQVLVTRVTSRPLTLDEIRAYGIVVDDDSFQAFNFTFGFAVEGDVLDYNVPVIWAPGRLPEVFSGGGGIGGSRPRFHPPPMAPFRMEFPPAPGSDPAGGCEDPEGDCTIEEPPPLPGVILFPTDLGLLHQFFSVVLMVQNGAPAGDPLTVRDLTAKIRVPAGLRQAETIPPTPLGVPVPVRVPGPDGEVGTADDLTFLIAQAAGEAEFLLEGLKEGTHVVEMDLEGVLEGLPGGIRRIVGRARGAVVVRDPTFGITITHPDVVRVDEEYSLFLTLANTSTSPANLLTLRLPVAGLSGVAVIGTAQRTIQTLLPGDSEVVEFRLRSLRTGRVTAASVRSTQHVNPTFELTVGVGENGIPLSPTSIVLPRSTENLPPAVVRHALSLIGLGFSIATAPPALLNPDLPNVTRERIDERVYQLAQAGRHVTFGEEPFDAAAVLAAEWIGARDGDWEWDLLRRTTQKGALLGAALAEVFAAEAAARSAEEAFERFASTTAFLGPLEAALVEGEGLRLSVESRMTGRAVAGSGVEADRLRDLSFADLYDLGAAELALLAVPEQSGYRVRVTVAEGSPGGFADLTVLIPNAAGDLRVVRFDNVQLGPGGEAVVAYLAADTTFQLSLDADGDGIVDDLIPGDLDELAPRPFVAVAAVQNAESDPSGHVIEVLFSQDVDLTSLLPRDPERFTIPGKVGNGGLIPAEAELTSLLLGEFGDNRFAGLFNSRVVRVVYDNPISPYVSQVLTVRDVAAASGEEIVEQDVDVVTTVTMPGTLVRGRVIGPDGEPAPFATVELVEVDHCPICATTCRAHRTAAVRADAAGEFLFDYVRQTRCGDLFRLEAHDPESGKKGNARGRVRFIGETVSLDVVMLGRGVVRGRVTYDDGTVPEGLIVQAVSPAFQEGRRANTDALGNYEVGDLPVGTITVAATDGEGGAAAATVEIASAGSVVERDLVIVRLSPEQTGEVRGTVYDPDGVTPVAEAWVALSSGGHLLGVRRSGIEGGFDFGTVPAGQAEIEAFSGDTGRSGARIFFEIAPDSITEVDVLLRDERGTVEGHVLREEPDGSLSPAAMAVVWANGTPFNTTTDAEGFYRLEGVFAGLQEIHAADLGRREFAAAEITVVDGETAVRDLVFERPAASGGIAGEVLDESGAAVSFATVHLALSDQQWFKEAFTDFSGTFVIPNMAPGVYEVHGFKNLDGGIAIAHVQFPGDTPFVTIRVKRGTIRGQVLARNESGELEGVLSIVRYRTTVVRLGLVGLDLESHDVETDAEGFFELPNVLIGDYTLTVFNAFHGQKTVRGELVSHGEIAEHELIFERNGDIAGVVLDHDGTTPVEGARVELHHPNFSVFDLTTDAEGRFTFELVPPTAVSRPFPIDATFDDGMVFRKARVWVSFHQFGQHLEVQLVLPKQGSVAGSVEDANGAPVPGATVTLQESEFPNRTLIQETDGAAMFHFGNVIAGRISLSARAPALGGLGGRTTVDLTEEGEEITGVVIRLEDTGEITGRVVSPVDGSAVANAQVRLYRSSLFDSGNSDADGAFAFTLLPLSTYEIGVFDPATGRAGRVSGITISANGQVEDRTVVLEARGSVDGHLYEPRSSVPVPGATVRLDTRSLISLTTYASTGVEGDYLFDGIPQGTFTLAAREPGGRRRAGGAGEIVTEDQQVTIDLFLEEAGSVTGTALAPVGAPAGPFTPVNVFITQGGQVIGSGLAPAYHFEDVLAGQTFLLSATEPGGLHRGEAAGQLAFEGQEAFVDVRIQPIGRVRITVVDSGGAPVVGAEVSLTSRGFYGFQRFAAPTGGGNTVAFDDVGAGSLSAFATDPATLLTGSTTGALALEGEQVELTVQLQPSGEVRGMVLLADGATPATGALAVLQRSGRTYTVTTDPDGTFSFPSIPLGSFTLDFQESFGPGTLRVFGTIAADGQVVDLGTLVLDDADPQLIEILPASGAIAVPVEQVVRVRFSEPIDTAAFSSSWVELRRNGGSGVAVAGTFEDGGATVVLTPNQPLSSFTSYLVKVSTAVRDPAGRHLQQAIQTSFTTRDVAPPVVVDLVPDPGAVQVPVEIQLAVTFSEPVELVSLSGSALQLTDETAGTGVTTTFTLQPSEREVLITPVAALAPDHAHRLVVQGVRDRSGNTMAAAFEATFQTLDTEPPVIELVVPEGPLTEGAAVTLTATPIESPDIASVSFFAGGVLIATDATAPFEVLFAPTEAHATAGTVELSAAAIDDVDNAGALVAVTRTVLPDLPPEVTLTLDPPDEISVEQVLTVTGHAADATGIDLVRLIVTGAVTISQNFTPAGDPPTFDLVRTFTIPTVPSELFVEVVLRVTDVLGKVTETAPVRVTVVADTEAPVFGTVTPAEGTELVAGDSVTITAAVTDNLEVESVTFHFGEQSATRTAVPYRWIVPAPAVEEPTDLPITIDALDTSGNEASFVRTVRVLPLADPDRPEIAILCPTAGALLAPGTGIDVAVDAVDDQGVEKVEFFLGTDPTPVATDFTAPYTYRLDAPAGAVEGDTLELRAVVSDFGGKTDEASVSVAIVEGVVYTTNTTLSAPAHAGESVIVDGATLTIAAPQSFRDLVVLDRGVVAHPFSTATSPAEGLDLTLDRDLYVACGARVDVSARGYTLGRGHLNNPAEGPTSGRGGSHGGRGGDYDGSSPVYGSLFAPFDLGAGGAGGGSSAGGGAVRITAAGSIVVDGEVASRGVRVGTLTSTGGAGGSIALAGARLAGGGSIDAGGAVEGSGGRIALRGGEIDEGLIARTRALGGPGVTGAIDVRDGAAGTIYVLADGGVYGTLIVDNGTSTSTQPTELLAVGEGTVTAVGTDSITDAAADFRHSLAGARVVFNGDVTAEWVIAGNDHHGQTLTLDVDGHPLTAVPGDLYEGRYRFDRLIVRGGAVLIAEDPILTSDPPEIGADSALHAGGGDPAVRIRLNRETEILPGQVLDVRIAAADYSGLDLVEVELSGAIAAADSFAPGGAVTAGQRFTYTLPLEISSTSPQTLAILARATAADGGVGEAQRSLIVPADNEGPQVVSFLPADGTAVVSGQAIQLNLSATDNVGIREVAFELADRTLVDTIAPYLATIRVPPVATPTAVPLVARLTDYAGNTTEVTHTLQVSPVGDAEPPILAVTCPGSLAVLPPGATLRVTGTMTDPVGVYRLDLFLGAGPAPALTVYPPTGATTFDVPATVPVSAIDGDEPPLRLVATDFGGNQAEYLSTVRVVEGTAITASTTLAAGDLSLDGQSVIVSAGTLTVEGAHGFRDLVVIGTGTVTHPPTSATTEHRLDLAIERDVYIGCGRSISAAGRGYLGAPVDGVGYTYPNTQTGGAELGTGGSHGGRGGFSPVPNPAYGSLFAPRDPGAGGGSVLAAGGAGGGAVVVQAGGDVGIDGSIDVRGAGGTSLSRGGGAGGSVQLHGTALGGLGLVQAQGGDSPLAGGAGGRVALYAATIEEGLLDRVSVRGGTGSSNRRSWGTAGTLFAKRDAQPLGDLILDNGGFVSNQTTDLLAVGSGVVDAVGAGSITDFEAAFRHSLAGAEVAFNGDLTARWEITGHEHLGQTLTLDVSLDPLAAQPGDAYRGVWRFDRVIVRGAARGVAADPVFSTDPPEVAPGSFWISGNFGPPEVQPGLVTLATGILGLEAVGEPGAVTDPDAPIRIAITNPRTGQSFAGVAAADGSFRVLAGGEDGDLLELVAIDSHADPLASSVVVLGPIAGNARRPAVEPGGVFPTAAVGDGLLVFFDADLSDPPAEEHRVALFDLADPTSPVAAGELLAQTPSLCLNLCGDGCIQERQDCLDGCPGAPDPPACEAQCEAEFDACTAGCGAACEAVPPVLFYGVGDLAVGAGVVAIAQGPFLRIVDARDPYQPIWTPPQDLDLTPAGAVDFQLEEVRLTGGYAHLLGLDSSEEGSTANYLVADVHDPRAPRVVGVSEVEGFPVDLEVAGGRAHQLFDTFGGGGEVYRVAGVGDPGSPVPVTSATTPTAEGHRLELAGDLAVFTQWTGEVATVHRQQAPGSEAHLAPAGVSGRIVPVVVGDRVLVAETDFGDLAVGHLDSTLAGHGFVTDAVLPRLLADGFDELAVAEGLLWQLGLGRAIGHPTPLLRPYLDERAIIASATATGATLAGGAGAVGAGGVEVEASAGGAAPTAAPVASDGSFSLALAGVEAGERIVLRARDAEGGGGNLVTLAAPAGTAAGRLDLPEGVRRLAIDGNLGAAVPAREGSPTVTVPVIDLEAPGAPALLSTVEVDGPVGDVALRAGYLYVAAGRLEVFDLTDPSAPVHLPAGALDLYAGSPVEAMVLDGGVLRTAGLEPDGDLGLYAVDLTNPAVPVQDGAATVELPPLASPRLAIEAGELWLIGDGAARVFDLAGTQPVEIAAGAFAGRIVDLQPFDGEIRAAVTGEGVRRLDRSGGVLTLGPAPVEPHPAFGLFPLTSAQGERLWWAEGLGGLATVLDLEEPEPGRFVPRYGRIPTWGLARDAVTAGDRLYVLTDFALLRVDLLP